MAVLNRRNLQTGASAMLLLSGCVRSAKTIGGDWSLTGTNGAKIDHDPWDRLLAHYAKPGADGINRFADGAVTPASRSALKAYLAALQRI